MDSYEVIRPLASGSFGQIFLVSHRHEKKKYVLKKISVLSLDAKERESVEQEVRSSGTGGAQKCIFPSHL